MSRVVGAAFYALAARYISLLIQLVSVMAISRLLTPKEIGIYSISASLFGLALLIRDFGIGSYLIQEKKVDGELAASAFTMSLLLCWPLSLMAYYVGPYVSSFYEIDEMVDVFRFLAINLLVIPFGSITLSLLKREMQFNKVMIIDIGSSFTSASVTIICCLNELGFMSLAYGSVAGTLATVFLALCYRPNWVPLLPGTGRLKDIASFGWRIGGSNLLSQVYSTSPDMIIGKVQGPEGAVFFNKTVSVFKLFNQLFLSSLRPVLQSHVADLKRSEDNIFSPVVKLNGYYLALAWPFAVFLLFNADAVVYILFGEQWGRVVPLIKIMCISYAIESIYVFHQSTMAGIGEANRILKYVFIVCFAQIFILLIFSSYHLEVIAMAIILVSIVRLIVAVIDMKQVFECNTSDLFKDFLTPIKYSVFLALINFLYFVVSNDEMNLMISFLIVGVVNLISYLFIITVDKHYFFFLVLNLIKKKFDI